MAAAEVQTLLRFLTQDAKIPLAEAMPKIGALRKLELNTPLSIAEANHSKLQEIFNDEKSVKQVIAASKRLANPKKRTAVQRRQLLSNKPNSTNIGGGNQPRDTEAELVLPVCEMPVEELEQTVIETNRAPLVLAFALVMLEYSMPEQPLSSRLSLAQAVVSANSQTKAKSIGLTGPTAEEEGWAQGQPKVKVLGREVAVMRRQLHLAPTDQDSQETVKADEALSHDAFWGLDIEALRKSNGPPIAGKLTSSQGPPIHTPQAARSYLLKSISKAVTQSDADGTANNQKKKLSPAQIAEAKEETVAMLLQSIRLVCESWVTTLSASEMDKRAWSWYLSVRPEVAQGQSGWGQRGQVRLAEILRLRRDP